MNRPKKQFTTEQPFFIIKTGMHLAFRELYEGPTTFDVIDMYDPLKRFHLSPMTLLRERK